MKSVNEVVMGFPDETVVFPGHGPSSTIGQERKTNPYVYK
jgi:glyoxylase-like metal-dependent hydrolase (beta-lactamase superfamily II)